MAKISVIIPCYNAERWIDRCLISIEKQTIGLKELEIICVDDASTDGTAGIIKQWELKYPEQIQGVICKENGRQGTARNIGLQHASAEWVAFLDVDDWVEPEYFSHLYEMAMSGDYDLAACGDVRDSSEELRLLSDEEKGMVLDPPGGKALTIGTKEERAAFIHEQPLKLSAWGKLIRKNFLTENGILFPERLAYEDIFWGEVLYLYVNRFIVSDAKLYHYFVNNASTVLKKDAWYHADMLTVQAKLYLEWVRRGALDLFPEELEYEYIYTGVLAFLKLLAFRFENPPYALFQLLQVYHAEHFPNAASNRYLAQAPEFHRLLVRLLGMTVTPSQFLQVMEQIRTIGI